MSTWARRWRRGPALLVLVLAATLTGCAAPGSDDSGSPHGLPRYYDAGRLLAAVTQRQHADRTAELTVHGTVTGDTQMAFTGTGAVRLDPTTALRLDQTESWPGGVPRTSSLVVVGGGVYLHGSDDPSRWLRAASAATEADRLRAALATALGDISDPTSNLARYVDSTLVAGADDDVVDGAPVVRYGLVVDLSRAAVLQPDPALRAQLEQQVRDGLTRITSTLWVDAANRPVGTELHQALPGVGTLAVTAEYRSWGVPVRIDAPPAAEVR